MAILNGSTYLFALAEFCLIVAEHRALSDRDVLQDSAPNRGSEKPVLIG